MSQPKDVWESYKNLLVNNKFNEWGELWIESGTFVVMYGTGTNKEPVPVPAEARVGRADVVSLFSESANKIAQGPIFSNDVVYETTDPDVFFIIFIFDVKLTNGYSYVNHIACRVTLEDGKIKELIEYADPNKRQAFIEQLKQIMPTS